MRKSPLKNLHHLLVILLETSFVWSDNMAIAQYILLWTHVCSICRSTVFQPIQPRQIWSWRWYRLQSTMNAFVNCSQVQWVLLKRQTEKHTENTKASVQAGKFLFNRPIRLSNFFLAKLKMFLAIANRFLKLYPPVQNWSYRLCITDNSF